MSLGQYISNTVLLDLWQLYEIDEKQYNLWPLMEQLVMCVYNQLHMHKTARTNTHKREGVWQLRVCANMSLAVKSLSSRIKLQSVNGADK